MMKVSELASLTSPQSPTTYGLRSGKLDRITIHCVVGEFPASQVMGWFAKPERKASSSYVIGKNGEIGCSLYEDYSPCTSGSSLNDKRAITIECSSGATNPYAFNEEVYNSLINLCVDICRRYDKKELVWIADKQTALEYDTKSDKMLLTVHRWFQNVECPGSWMMGKMSDLVEKVNKKIMEPVIGLNVLYKVQVGAFAKKENAERLKKELRKKGYNDCFIVKSRI